MQQDVRVNEQEEDAAAKNVYEQQHEGKMKHVRVVVVERENERMRKKDRLLGDRTEPSEYYSTRVERKQA